MGTEKIKGSISSGENWDKAPFRELVDPFIFQRADGSVALVQTWPISYNEKWRQRFGEIVPFSEDNPYPDVMEDVAADDFAIAMERLWGRHVNSRNVERIEFVSQE